jgi:hypothetical protein
VSGSRLLPDGQGGLLIADRTLPKVARYHPSTGVTAPVWLVPEGSWREGVFEVEYVVGGAGGGALVKDHQAGTIRAGLVTFDPVSPTEQWPQVVGPADNLQLRLMLADGTMHVSGSGIGLYYPNDDRLVPDGVWGAWTPGPATFITDGMHSNGVWSRPLGRAERNNQSSNDVTLTINAFIPEEWVALPLGVAGLIYNGNDRGFGRIPPAGSSAEVTDHWSKTSFTFSVNSAGGISGKTVHIGPTREYDHGSSVDASGALTHAAKADTIAGDGQLMTRTARGRSDGHELQAERLPDGTIRITVSGSAPHPFFDLPLVRHLATIDYKFTIVLNVSNPSSITYNIEGSHDGFPNYEVYIDTTRVYEWSHGTQTPGSLAPPMEWAVAKTGSVPR